MTALLYLLLAATGTFVFSFTWRRHGSPAMVSLSFVSGAAIALGDLLAHGLLSLYIYNPHLLPVLQADGPLGLVLADFLFVPGSVVSLIAMAPQRRWAAGLLLSLGLVLTEYAFEKLEIFHHTGWRLEYSLLLFPLYFGLLIPWLHAFQRRGYTGLFRLATLTAASIWGLFLWIATSALILGLWRFQPGILGESFPDMNLGVALFHSLPALILLVPPVVLRWTQRPAAYALLASAWYGWQLAMRAIGLMKTASTWHPLLSVATFSLLLLGLEWLDRWCLQRQPVHTQM